MQAVGASRRVFELLDRESKQPPAGEATPKGSQGGGEVIFEERLVRLSRPADVSSAAWPRRFGSNAALPVMPCDHSRAAVVRLGPEALQWLDWPWRWPQRSLSQHQAWIGPAHVDGSARKRLLTSGRCRGCA